MLSSRLLILEEYSRAAAVVGNEPQKGEEAGPDSGKGIRTEFMVLSSTVARERQYIHMSLLPGYIRADHLSRASHLEALTLS